mgnify:CR=1 FL=1
MDYSTAALNAIWAFLIIIFLKILPFSLNTEVGIFIILYFPLLLFSILGFNNENILYVLSYLFHFFINSKVYFYGKD